MTTENRKFFRHQADERQRPSGSPVLHHGSTNYETLSAILKHGNPPYPFRNAYVLRNFLRQPSHYVAPNTGVCRECLGDRETTRISTGQQAHLTDHGRTYGEDS